MWTLVLNATNWLAAGLGVAAVVVPCRVFGDGLAAKRPLRGAAAVLTVAAVLAGASVAARLVLGFAAPGAYAEDVAAARLLLDGRPVAGGDRDAVREWLTEEQVSHDWLAGGLSACQTGAAADRARFFTSQGHPPFLLVASVPIVAWAGGRGLFVVVTALTLLLLAVAGSRLVTELVPDAAPWQRALAIVAIAGWQPVLAGLRQGDAALMASALVVIAWAALRRRHAIGAGLSIGAAASVSIGALLAVAALAFQRPRAALAALATVSAGLALAAAVGGAQLLGAVADAGHGAAVTYAAAGFNYSLAGRMLAGSPWALILGVATAALCAAAVTSVMQRRPPSGSTPPAGENDLLPLLCCAVVLGSPVAWSQHLAFTLLPLSVLLASQVRKGSRAGLLSWCGLVLTLSLPDQAVTWIAGTLGTLAAIDSTALPPVPLAGLIALTTWLVADVLRAGRPDTRRLTLSDPHQQPAWAGEHAGGQP